METFNDGIINVLKANDGVITETIFKGIHFGNRTFGATRFFNSKVAGSEITRMISIPDNFIVSRENLIELKEFRTGKTHLYEIAMYQPKYDTKPSCIYLSLKSTSIEYTRLPETD
jgi:hypothetical protein